MTDKEREFQVAWYDYCIINRLIAYGEVPELTEEQIEARCMEQLKKIKFQPTQPSFYKKYCHLPIKVIAYNAKTDKVHTFMTYELFMKASPYYMNERAEVDLNKAEVTLCKVD